VRGLLSEAVSSFKCVAETVARFDGFIAKYMGDGVLVYFVDTAAADGAAPTVTRSPSRICSALHTHRL
jgi:class 3 adenylate cyclase